MNTNDIRFKKSHPNTNTNIIRFENIDRIRIRIFWYSNIIRIIFEYRIICSPLASTSPTIGGGRVVEGCSFSAVPKFRRRPNPTIPLHSKFINDHHCFWHHTFSTNSSSTIRSSILSMTRCGGLYIASTDHTVFTNSFGANRLLCLYI